MTLAPPVAIAIGDPNGIGPEIAIRAALAQPPDARPLLVGDAHVVQRTAERIAAGPMKELSIAAIDAFPADAFVPGTPTAASGRATVAYVEEAVRLVRGGAARAVVACPHSETAVRAAGIPFSGYPSLLERLSGVPVFLLLIGGGLRIVHATLHERLADALARLDAELVAAAATAAVDALRRLGITRPRIGVCGINPHAGEDGLFGDDDARVTVPAVAALRAAGIDADGPAGADLMLGRPDRDAFVAMYHDQGHIPVKLLAGRAAAALSVGGGLLFTSVAHGAAFDIAGLGRADPSPLLAALRLVESVDDAREVSR